MHQTPSSCSEPWRFRLGSSPVKTWKSAPVTLWERFLLIRNTASWSCKVLGSLAGSQQSTSAHTHNFRPCKQSQSHDTSNGSSGLGPKYSTGCRSSPHWQHRYPHTGRQISGTHKSGSIPEACSLLLYQSNPQIVTDNFWTTSSARGMKERIHILVDDGTWINHLSLQLRSHRSIFTNKSHSISKCSFLFLWSLHKKVFTHQTMTKLNLLLFCFQWTVSRGTSKQNIKFHS